MTSREAAGLGLLAVLVFLAGWYLPYWVAFGVTLALSGLVVRWAQVTADRPRVR